MKKFIICISAALLAATIVLTCQLSKLLDLSSSVSRKINALPISAFEAFADMSDSEIYTVKKYREKIGIFKNGETAPETVLDVYVFSLPERDRILLNVGFDVTDDKLFSVIEDYTG